MSASSPSSTFTDDRHLFIWGEPENTEVSLERFYEDSKGGLRAEITVSTSLLSAGRISGPTQLNLLSDRSIKGLASTCEKRVDLVDWYAVLAQACALSVSRRRDGDPLAVHKSTDDVARRWLLEPFLEADGWTVLYAQKGSAKSYLAAAISLSVASGRPVFGVEPAVVGPVAYLDWEGSKREFDVRLTKLRRSLEIDVDPEVFYRFGETSLYSSVPSLRRRFTELGVVMAVVDSKSVAMSGAPDGVAVLEVNRGIRRLGVPVLLVDHKSKAAIKSVDPDMAIGSVHTGNAARLVWSVKSETFDGEITQRLVNTEANNGPKSKPFEVTFRFTEDETQVLTSGVPKGAAVDDVLPVPY